MQASTSLMVPDQHLPRIAGFNQIVEGGVRIAGPALGALLMEAIPIQGVLAIDVITAAIAILPLFFIAIPQPVNGKGRARVTPRLVVQDVLEGVRYVLSWKGFTILLGMAVFLNFVFAPAGSFLPLLVTEHFRGGVWELGLLQSTVGVGMLIGGVLLGIWGGFRRRVLSIVLGMGAMGVAALLVGVSPADAILLAGIALLIEGVANTIMNGSAFALIQSVIAADMQGRIFSMLASVTSALSPLGLLLAAPIVEGLGVQSWYVFVGVCCVVLAAVALLIPAVMNLEKNAVRFTGAESVVQEALPAGDC